MASSRAQNVNDKLFGGEYTYIEFVATKPHQYPVCFAALSTKDTIKIDRSNLKAFIKSIYSTCVYTPISDMAYWKAFERVLGDLNEPMIVVPFLSVILTKTLSVRKNQ